MTPIVVAVLEVRCEWSIQAKESGGEYEFRRVRDLRTMF